MEKQSENLNDETLLAALNELEKTNNGKTDVGACLFTPPSAPVKCFQLSREQCTAINGVYIGGNCPSKLDELELSQIETLPQIQKSELRGFTRDEMLSATSEDILNLGNLYLIVFINKSNRCFTSYRFRFINQPNWTSWANINICRTCSLNSLQECFNSKQWRDLFVIDCSAGAFELEIRETPNSEGYAFTLQSDTYYPDCTKAGGVVSWAE